MTLDLVFSTFVQLESSRMQNENVSVTRCRISVYDVALI